MWHGMKISLVLSSTQRERSASEPGTAGPPQTVSPGPCDYSVPRFAYIQAVPKPTERSQHPVMGCKGHPTIPLLHQAESWCKPAPKQLCHSAGVTSPLCASLPLSTPLEDSLDGTHIFIMNSNQNLFSTYSKRAEHIMRSQIVYPSITEQAGSEQNQRIRAKSSKKSWLLYIQFTVPYSMVRRQDPT